MGFLLLNLSAQCQHIRAVRRYLRFHTGLQVVGAAVKLQKSRMRLWSRRLPTPELGSLPIWTQTETTYSPCPRAMKAKETKNKWDYIKMKSFFTAKETMNKTRKPTV